VAFPTETVYGLGANALDATAVQRVFAAKDRPAINPLIVHTLDRDSARGLSRDWPPTAEALARVFWPGPLTLVLHRREHIPDIVTAGGETVALRVPDHPIARALLTAAQRPIAAPSANRSGAVSPTLADHVLEGLGGLVDLILDGGPCRGGLESTVVDLTTDPPRALRPGLVPQARLREVLGKLEPAAVPGDIVSAGSDAALRSPGQLGRHYAPRARLECHADGFERVRELLDNGWRVGWITRTARAAGSAQVVRLAADVAGYSAGLYSALHALDAAGVEYIVVDEPPADEAWAAVRDRLRRAAWSR